MKPLTRIARLSAAFLTSNLAGGVIAFGLSLVIGRSLGVERFGRWILCTTWASVLTVLADLGFGLLLTRDGALGGARRGMLCGTALIMRVSVAIPAAACLAIAAARLAPDAETVAGLRVAALVGVAGAAYGCFGSTFRSQPRWIPAILTLETGWAGLQLAGSWILLWRFGPSVGVAQLLAIAVAAQLGRGLSALVVWRFAFAGDPVSVPRWRELTAVFRRALPFAASGIVSNLQTRLAPLLIAYLSTQTELGRFAAAARFGTTAKLAPGAIFAGALPVLAQEHDEGAEAGLAAYASFHRSVIALVFATALPCIVAPSLLLRLVYGAAFSGAAPALTWIGIGLVPALTNSAKKVFLYAAGAERAALAWSAVSLVVQAAAAGWLVPRFGSVGGAVSLALGEVVIWWPLVRTVRRIAQPSSRHRGPASTLARPRPGARDVADPATVR